MGLFLSLVAERVSRADRFKEMDANGDGFLSVEEFKLPPPPGGKDGGGKGPPKGEGGKKSGL